MVIVSQKYNPLTVGIGHRCLSGRHFSDWMSDLKKQLKKYSGCFDTIVCRGKSGMLAAGYLAASMNKNIIIIRKSTNNAHAAGLVEYWESPERYIIVDDFISSGATMANITSKMKKLFPKAKLVAIALYDDDERDVECDFGFAVYKKINKLWGKITVVTPNEIYYEELFFTWKTKRIT